MRYAVVIEKGEGNYGAYVPEFHLEGLRADGSPIPEPTSRISYVELAA